MMLRLQDLSIGYHGKECVAPINIEVREGNIHFLLGVNGIGKSTLLRTMAGLIKPIAGSVTFNGQNIHSLDSASRASLVSYHRGKKLIQSRISVYEFMMIGLMGSCKENLKEEIEAICSRFGVLGKMSSIINELSDGEFQKVQLALTILRDCPVILLDEPLSFLDPPSQMEMLDLFKEIAKKRILLLSSHIIGIPEMKTEKIFSLNINKKFNVHDSQALELDSVLKDIYGGRMINT